MTYFTEFGFEGPGDFSSECHIYEDNFYIYNPFGQSEGDGNFGAIRRIGMSNDRKL